MVGCFFGPGASDAGLAGPGAHWRDADRAAREEGALDLPAEGLGNELAGLLLDAFQMGGAEEAFGVNLVYVFGA